MSTAGLVDAVRSARARRAPVRVRGAGTWLDAGRPVDAELTLSLADDRGIVEYVPGDLTLTARAGTPLSELVRATEENGQWLPLAPWGAPHATLGATISTATAGPFAAAFGVPRDAVLGMEFVTGTGDVVRSGGRVVKNVAGFDLTRLLTGSWGTLGVIAEATVRLRSLPQVARTLTIAVDAAPASLASACATIRALPFAPFACELLNAGMARHLGIGDDPTLLVMLGGNSAAVAAAVDALRPLGSMDDAESGVLDALRAADAGAAATWRMSSRPSRFPQTWAAAQSPDVLVHGNPVRGVARVVSPSAGSIPIAFAASGGSVVVERLPRDAWVRVPPPPADPLARAVRSKFDPDGILNPGILGDYA